MVRRAPLFHLIGSHSGGAPALAGERGPYFTERCKAAFLQAAPSPSRFACHLSRSERLFYGAASAAFSFNRLPLWSWRVSD